LIRYAAFFIMLFAGAALAEDPAPASAPAPAGPRTIDMTQVVIDNKGKPVPDTSQITPDDPTCSKCQPLTVGSAIATALLMDHREEQNVSAIDKARRAALAMRIQNNTAVKLTPKEVVEISRLMNVWGAIVVVRVLPIIDPNVDLNQPQ
jgi:hypothetical protein